MPLLDLPPEIFALVVAALGHQVGHKKLLAHRRVCRTFDKFILYYHIETAAKVDFATWADRIDNKALSVGTTEIMCRKLLYRIVDNAVVENVRRIVDNIVTHTWPLSAEASEQLRVAYTKSICDCMRAFQDGHYFYFLHEEIPDKSVVNLGLLPAALAAVGDTQLFLNNVSSIEDILTAHKKLLPNALDAAVAAGQNNMVELILRCLLTTVRGPWETGTWDEMRTVARSLVEALGVAVRISHDILGDMILQCFVKNKALAGSVRRSVVNKLYEDCVRFGSTKFFYTALYWKRNEQFPDLSKGSGPTNKLSPDELTDIICKGPPHLLRHIIKTGRVNLINVGGETPLWLALKTRKYRTAVLLLEKGANIEGMATGQKLTAYWRAYKDKDGDAQWLLISKGADTRPMSQRGNASEPARK